MSGKKLLCLGMITIFTTVSTLPVNAFSQIPSSYRGENIQETSDNDLKEKNVQEILPKNGYTEISNQEVLSDVNEEENPELMERTSGTTSGTCGEDMTWTLDENGVLIICGSGEMDSLSFSDNKSIREVKIEAGVTSIGEYAFSLCSNLTSITIPDSVTSIGKDAFNDCSSLEIITIPDSVTSIGTDAFGRCSSLKNITIPDSVTSIGNLVFSDCSSLEIITIPDSVTSIGDYAFYRCSSLTSIAIPDSVTNIGLIAFGDCSSLTSITIPESVTSIGEYAFRGCSSLTSIDVDKDNPLYSSVDSILFNKEQTILYTCPGGKSGNCVIPDSVTSIGQAAFGDCSSLTSITIPDSVTSIGNYAFNVCSSLTSITIPESVTSIGEGAFSKCSSLTSITIPDSITNIGDYVFNWCSSLESVTIPESVTSIGQFAFSICSSLTGITIPDSVTSIGQFAFAGCSSLTSITIPNSVTSIEDHVFNYCSNLTSMTIPNSVTNIGLGAFNHCSSLESITIPNSVTSIGDYAFFECDELTIYGTEGSYAQQYASENHIPFKLVGSPSETPTDIPTVPAVTVTPTIPATPTVTVTPTVTPVPGASDAIKEIETNVVNGEASVSVSEDDMDSLMQGAANSDQTTLTLKVVGADGADRVTVEIPKKSLSDIASKDSASLDVVTVLGTLSLDKKVLDAVVNTAQTDFVRLVMEKEQADDTYKDMFGSNVSVTKMFFQSGDTKITDIGTNKITISLSVTDALQGKDLAVTYADADGKWVKLSGKYVTTDNDRYQFETPVLGELVLAEETAVDAFIQNQDKHPTETPADTPTVTPIDAPSVEPTNTPSTSTMPKKGTILKSKNVTYKITKKGSEVSYIKTSSTAASVTIPATVKISGTTYKVTSIASNAFKGNKRLSKVTIGKNITSIGKNAFRGCKNLKTVTIKSKKLKSVGKNAFKGIKSNAKIKVPSKKQKAYTKLLKGKGQGKEVKITK